MKTVNEKLSYVSNNVKVLSEAKYKWYLKLKMFRKQFKPLSVNQIKVLDDIVDHVNRIRDFISMDTSPDA